MGKMSREKGARYERKIAHMLQEYGYEAERGCQHAGGKDSPDVKHNMPNLHIETKNTEALNIWKALEQSERDAGEGEMAIVIFRRNRSKDYVALEFSDFMKLYTAWDKGGSHGKES